MDSTSMDRYEKQLYTVFKTFDVDNEEALDRAAVLDLCDALQLEDRGAALVDNLFERTSERVTFTQFRNGLLSVLGAGAPPPATAATASTRASGQPAHSDEDSSGREVAPKFVFGSKKYGRRSRPPSLFTNTAATRPETPEADRLARRMKCKRSAPAMDADNSTPTSPEPNELDHDKIINYEQSLELCRTLQMDGIDRKIVERIFEDSTSRDMTVGEFFDRLNASLTMSIASTCEVEAAGSGDEAVWGPGSTLLAEAVVEAWERAGVEHGRRLLHDLGFVSPTLRASELSQALDAELRALSNPLEALDARAVLLQATLVLQRLRLSRATQRSEAACAENTKLRADLADANRRAQTLAQEVDENHARIEASLKGRIRQLESKHAEESRAAAACWTAEKERSTAVIARLESTVTRLTNEEARLRTEINTLHQRNEEMSRRASIAEERASDLEAARMSLAAELKTLSAVKCDEAVVVDKVLEAELTSKLEELRLENKMLRDRNDELCAELELAARGAAGGVPGPSDGASWREEVRGARAPSLPSLHSLHNGTDECDQSLTSIDQKVFGPIEVARKLQGILVTVPQVNFNNDSGCESCNTLKGIITTIQDQVQELSDSVIIADHSSQKLDLSVEASVQTETQNDLESLRKEAVDAERKYEDEKQRLSNLVKDLEASLDQMKSEYDKCEEYWTNKLEEERDIYAEEQKLSDERLTELIAKISEYEQQFAPKANSNMLPTIDEKYSLELQFNDLEEEFENYKKKKENELTSKTNEIQQLKDRIKLLEEKCLNNGSNVSSPIEYLWSQGTIQTPYKNDRRCVRDYQNPAYQSACVESKEGTVRCCSDSEKDRQTVNPIQRPELAQRSASAGTLQTEADGPAMINCADLEGQLRQQSQCRSRCGAEGPECARGPLEARCRQLAAALRQRQAWLDAVQQAARSEGAALRARVAAAEGAVARLQARLTAADLLVKELFLENCQLAHRHTRLL